MYSELEKIAVNNGTISAESVLENCPTGWIYNKVNGLQ